MNPNYGYGYGNDPYYNPAPVVIYNSSSTTKDIPIAIMILITRSQSTIRGQLTITTVKEDTNTVIIPILIVMLVWLVVHVANAASYV